MQNQRLPRRPKSHTTISNTKRAVLGDTAGRVAPAWRYSVTLPHTGNRNGPSFRRDLRKHGSMGSKIFMSQLPTDGSVGEADIEELFQDTVGPVFDVFIVYNSQGKSKGMAVVNFQRPGDAMEARNKFNGKIIDGRRPMKIELISDPPAVEKTLAQRLGDTLSTGTKSQTMKNSAPLRTPTKRPQWRNNKKGPRRLKKSVEQLDREMEAYRAEAARFASSSMSAAALDITSM